MAVVSPFRAFRYDATRVGGLRDVIAPPYDVISAAEQAALYDRSPHNVVRLILARFDPGCVAGGSQPQNAKLAIPLAA